MSDAVAAAELVSTWGLPVIVPLAVIEGPVVSIIGGWMAKLGLVNPILTFAALVGADLVGDLLLYGIGRRGLARLPARWRNRFGLTDARMSQVRAHFRDHGARTLILGKLTHTPGAAVLVAAGSAHMPVLPFLFWNLLATLPKSALFFGIGWVFGTANPGVEDGLFWAAVLALGVFVLFLVRMHRKSGYPAE